MKATQSDGKDPKSQGSEVVQRAPLWSELVGWYGTGVIILAYFLVSFSILPANSVWYQLLNLTGALGLCAIAITKKVTQNVVINLFWMGIALIALIKVFVR